MVIEIDGSQHYTQDGMVYDKLRSDIINIYGIKVIRFSNYDIDKNFEGVCEEINKAIAEQLSENNS